MKEEKFKFAVQKGEWQTCTYAMTGIQGNLSGILAAFPFLLLAGGLYQTFLQERAVLIGNIPVVLMGILLISIPLHEGLHGLGWKLAGKLEKGEIIFSFRQGMPMCFCQRILPAGQYLIGVILPFLVLGMGSILFMIIYPGTLSVLMAFVNLTLSGADLVIACMVLRSGAVLAADCQDSAGFVGWKRRVES